MILVDIIVPSLDKKYDFKVNEEVPVSTVIEEIVQMISQKEQVAIIGDPQRLSLCNNSEKRVIPRQTSLLGDGIKTGDTLILI